jgi:Cdc6-like AAA superfamily ATPase
MNIIKNADALEEDFIPTQLFYRERELKIISDNLNLYLNGLRKNSFIFGPPGSGKTVSSKFISKEFEENRGVGHSYVNCWVSESNYEVLFEILTGLNPLAAQRHGASKKELFEEIRSILRSKKHIIILDEVDHLEDYSILYDLNEIRNAYLILIAPNEHVFFKADSRIISRIAGFEKIRFKRYSEEELERIILERMKTALFPGTFSVENSKAIAQISNGDARLALAILRNVAYEAEKENSDKISALHIEKAAEISPDQLRKIELSSLNPGEITLYNIISEKGEISTKELFKEYYLRAEEKVVERTLRKYLDRLEKYNLIEASRKSNLFYYKIKKEKKDFIRA